MNDVIVRGRVQKPNSTQTLISVKGRRSQAAAINMPAARNGKTAERLYMEERPSNRAVFANSITMPGLLGRPCLANTLDLRADKVSQELRCLACPILGASRPLRVSRTLAAMDQRRCFPHATACATKMI